METNEKLKQIVRSNYSAIAQQSKSANVSACCSPSGCGCKTEKDVMQMDYAQLKGYFPDADLGLGCGLPTQHAGIKPGDIVLDLGSGAGNDCFVARSLTGETGMVTGLDFTDKMVEKAIQNNNKLGYSNVRFIKGDIEEMPLPSGTFDVVISNCVLNLVPDKKKAFGEIFRVLRPGGHFCISDIVLEGELPRAIKEAAEMYAGCVSGAVQFGEYMSIIKEAGFISAEVKQRRLVGIPDDLLVKYLSGSDLADFKNSGAGLFSITVVAVKPG